MPECCFGILAQKYRVANKAMKWCHAVYDAVVDAEAQDMDANCAYKQALSDVMTDLAWNNLRLAREWLAQGRDCKWDLADRALRQRTWEMSATIQNTKTTCEDVFCDLQDEAARMGKHGKLQDWHLYYTVAHGSHASELPSLQVPEDKWSDNLPDADKTLSNMIFDATASDVHKSVQLQKLDGATRWKPAGPAANYRSAAATALLVHCKRVYQAMPQH